MQKSRPCSCVGSYGVGKNGKSHQELRYILPTSYTNIYQQGTIHDWNALPPRIFDFDDIGKFTDEIQQIYKL